MRIQGSGVREGPAGRLIMSQHGSNSQTTASCMRAEIETLLVTEMGYTPQQASQAVVRYEGLMLKAVRREQAVGPIALSIHLAYQQQANATTP